MVKAIITHDRYGRKVYRCPLCGHTFYKSSKYARHILKSHIMRGFKGKRKKKKLEALKLKIKEKLLNKEKLTPFEEVVYKHLRFRGIKF